VFRKQAAQLEPMRPVPTIATRPISVFASTIDQFL
jgi:hypothetical protein